MMEKNFPILLDAPSSLILRNVLFRSTPTAVTTLFLSVLLLASSEMVCQKGVENFAGGELWFETFFFNLGIFLVCPQGFIYYFQTEDLKAMGFGQCCCYCCF